MTFGWCFLISKIMRIGMQCHPSLYYVMCVGTILFVVQRNVFISLLWFYLVMQQVTNTVSLLKFQ